MQKVLVDFAVLAVPVCLRRNLARGAQNAKQYAFEAMLLGGMSGSSELYDAVTARLFGLI